MVIMGHIIGPFGVYGWVKVNPYTEYIDGLMQYSIWWLSKDNKDWQKVHVVSGRMNGSILNAKFAEYTDRTQAFALNGMQIAIPRDQLPDLSENGMDGYYWSDLIGTTVQNLAGEELGKIVGLLETGANDVLCIQNGSEDKKEILIPFVDQFIIKVDLKLSRVIVDWGKDD
ncbi:MAG: ribosome maturation factor RimM [Nitrosomonas sp.]|nr:ribosome maturation factor RimM [Nitrosomonas sp.]MBP9100180.1 ribosome maturation factor RimM [Nitrosomonas sp.]